MKKKSTTWAFQAGRMLDLIVSFGWQILAAALLTQEEFGQVAVATAIATFVVILSGLGGDELVSAARADAIHAVFRHELRLRGVLGIAQCAAAAALFGSAPIASAVLLYSAAYGVTNIVAALSTRLYAPSLLGVGVVAQGVAVLALLLLLRPTTASDALALVALAALLRAAITLPPAIWMGRASSRITSEGPSWKRRASLVASAASAPLLGRQIHVSLAAVLGVSLADIASYSVAYSLAYLVSTATILGIGATTLPRFADAVSSSDKGALAREWRSVVLSTSALTLPTLGISAAMAPAFIGLFYGPEYAESATPYYIALAVILAAQRLYGGGATNALLIATGQSRRLFGSVLAAVITTLAASAALLPLLGMPAALVAGGLATVVTGALLLRLAHRTHGAWPPVGTQAPIIAATALAICICLGASAAFPSLPDLALLGIAGAIGLLSLVWVNRKILGAT